MQTYLVTGKRAVHWAEGSAQPGQLFEAEFSQETESDHLAAGRLEIVPREYEVIGSCEVFETPPGGTFYAALPIEREGWLLGVHIERVEQRKSKPKAKAPADDGADKGA